MQLATETSVSAFVPDAAARPSAAPTQQALADYQLIRRNGSVVPFVPAKIAVAVTKAFLAVEGSHGAVSARVRDVVAQLTDAVVSALMRRQPNGGTFHIEDVQDQVELALMRSGEFVCFVSREALRRT